MATKLASLFIELAVNGDKLTAELKKSKATTRNWSKDVAKAAGKAKAAFAAVSVGAGIATAGITALYVSNSKTLDLLGKTASKLGDTTEDLRVFGLAAEYGGVSSESMYKNLERLTRRLGDAGDGAGPTAEAIQKLGLNIDDVIQQSPTEAFESIAKALENIENPAQRASIAVALLGKEGISSLNITSDVIQKATDDVEALGGALTSIQVAQIEAANDSVTRLGAGFDLAAERLTFKMAPAVQAVADQLFESAAQGDQLEGVLDSLVLSTLTGFSSVASVSGSMLRFIDGRSEIASLGILGHMMFGKKGFALGAAVGVVAGSVKDTFDSLATGLIDGTTDNIDFTLAEIDRLESKLKLRGAPILDSIFGDEGDAKIQAKIKGLKFQLSIQRQIATIEGGTVSSGVDNALRGTASLTSTAASGFELLAESLNDVISNYGKLGEAANDNGLLAPAGIGSVPDVEEPFKVVGIDLTAPAANESGDDELSPEELELQRKAEFRANYFSEQLGAEKNFQDTWTLFQESGAKDRVKILLNETSGALATLAQHSRTMFQLNKAVGLANATVSIATGITKALELPFPSNIAAAGKVALEGAAQLQTIAGAEFGGSGQVKTPSTTSPTTDVSSVNSSAAANDSSISDGSAGISGGGLTIMGFHTAGASEEQKDDERAQWFQRAQDNDLLVPNADGGFDYTGTGTETSYITPEYSRAS